MYTIKKRKAYKGAIDYSFIEVLYNKRVEYSYNIKYIKHIKSIVSNRNKGIYDPFPLCYISSF